MPAIWFARLSSIEEWYFLTTVFEPYSTSSSSTKSILFHFVGFSDNQFAFDDPALGNVVTLTGNGGVKVPCHVVETDTSETKISCELG